MRLSPRKDQTLKVNEIKLRRTLWHCVVHFRGCDNWKFELRNIFSNRRITWVKLFNLVSKTPFSVKLELFEKNWYYCRSLPLSAMQQLVEKQKYQDLFLKIAFLCENKSKMCFRSWMLSIIIQRSFLKPFWHINYIFN